MVWEWFGNGLGMVWEWFETEMLGAWAGMTVEKPETNNGTGIGPSSYLFKPLMETPERYFPAMLEKTLAEPSKVYDLTHGFLETDIGSLNVEPWKWVMLGDRLLQKWSPRRPFRAPILEKLAALNTAQITPTLEWLCRSRREPLDHRLRAAELLLPFNAALALHTLVYWCHRPAVQKILAKYESKPQLFSIFLRVFSTAYTHRARPWANDAQRQVKILKDLFEGELEPFCVENLEAELHCFRVPTDISKRYLSHRAAFSIIRWLGALQSDALIEKYPAILQGDRDRFNKHISCFGFYVFRELGQYPFAKIESLLRSTLRGDYLLDYASFNLTVSIIQKRQWHQHFQADLLAAGHRCLNLPMPGPMLPCAVVIEALASVKPPGFFELLTQALAYHGITTKKLAIQYLGQLYPKQAAPTLLAFLLETPGWLRGLWGVEDEALLWHDYAEARLRDWDAPIVAYLAAVEDRAVAIALQNYLRRLKPEVHLVQRIPWNVRDQEQNKRRLIYALLDYFCQQPVAEFTSYFISLLPELEALMAVISQAQAEAFETFGAGIFERMIPAQERLLEKLVQLLGNSGDGRAIAPLQRLQHQAQALELLDFSAKICQSIHQLESSMSQPAPHKSN